MPLPLLSVEWFKKKIFHRCMHPTGDRFTSNKAVILCSHTRTHPFNGPLSGTIRVSRYQKGKANLDFTEARGSEWQWHQLGHMQVCTLLQTDNHTSTPPLSCSEWEYANQWRQLEDIQRYTIWFSWMLPTFSRTLEVLLEAAAVPSLLKCFRNSSALRCTTAMHTFSPALSPDKSQP